MPVFDFHFDENNIAGSLAELMRYLRWYNEHLDSSNIKYFAWGDSIVDNVDSTHKLKLKFYIPDGVLKVQKLRLNFSVEAFRAYETGAASGGGSTATSSSGGGSTETSSSGAFDYDTVTLGAKWQGTTDGIQAYTNPDGVSTHSHNIHFTGHDHTVTDEGGTYTTSQSMVNVDKSTDTDGAHNHNVVVYSHYHDLNPSGLIHDHSVVIPSHTHGVAIPAHAHDITYGIYESTSAAGCKVYVDGTLRLDNGGAGYSADQANLDLTQWVSTAGWHTIEVSSTQLGRINAAYFMQVYVGASGI